MLTMNTFFLGLLQAVPEGDYEALVAIMGYLMHVKERALTTDDMFQPLTETIELLKFYDMDIPEEVNVLLQVGELRKKSIICIFRGKNLCK